MEREQEELLEICFDGDKEKGKALVRLIQILTNKEVVKKVPETRCFWCHGEECWLNIPDSVTSCMGACNLFLDKEFD